jgi:molybdate/tungstate transport system substrate-binding protein
MRLGIAVLSFVLAACGGRGDHAPAGPITVFAAASLARPLETLADSFQRRENVAVRAELGGSMEQSRKITDLGRIPDVLILVDDDVIAALAPAHLEWYVRFATNRLVVAFSATPKHTDSLTTENWWRVLSRPGIRLGRANPTTAPAGRRALELLQRSEAYYQQRGLTDTLLSRSAVRFMRPNATELAALLETGEVDYIIEYESVARQYGFAFVALPADLASDVLYGLSVPRNAPASAAGVKFAAFVLSAEGMRILRDAHVNVLATPVAVGTNVPSEISALVRTLAATAR